MAEAHACSYRPVRQVDLARCVELFRAGGVQGALLDEALLGLWLEADAFVACVFEEHAPGGNIVRGCGFSAFVSPETAVRIRRGEMSAVADTLLRSLGSAHPLLLSRFQQARQNAAGAAHLIMLNFAIDDSVGVPVAAIEAVCNKAFLEAHNGYGLGSHAMEIGRHEPKAEMLRQSALAMGYQVAPGPAGAARQVYFLERSMFDAHPFHTLSMLFSRRLPRMGFTFAQQDLLGLALRGCTDEVAAAELGIGRDTVHKRWAAIFERAGQALPGLLGQDAAGAVVRGTEKRRPLLQFLADNPQELRPFGKNPR